LNAFDVKPDYKCFSFGKDAEGFSYYPEISKDIIETHVVKNRETKQRTLSEAYWFDGKVYIIDTKNKKFYL
jgi:hypothetical protein